MRLDRPAKLGPDDSIFYLAEAERLDEEHYTATRVFGAIGARRTFSDTFFVGGRAGSILDPGRGRVRQAPLQITWLAGSAPSTTPATAA